MADYFFDSLEDFHYDNSGYYGYIVFNGDEKALNGLRNALGQGRQSHGLGWYRYGKSFRPANDGRMYDWYIRLHSGGNDKPAAQNVDDFLRSYLQPRQPVQQQPASQGIVHDLLVETLGNYQKSIESLEHNVNELRSDVQAGTAARTELEDMRKQLESAEETRERAEQAQIEAENDLKVTQAELEAARTEGPGDQYWHEKYNELEDQNRKLNRRYKAMEREIKSLARDLKKAEEARDNYATQFLETSKKIGELEKAASVSQLPPVVPARNNNRASRDDLKDILEGAFPGMIFVEDSLETLYRGIENYRSVMALLHRIKNEPLFNGRNAMHGRKQISKWREDTIDKRGRIYFCKESRLLGDKIVVYISVKNEQESRDENWLMRNPPDRCLEKALAQRT